MQNLERYGGISREKFEGQISENGECCSPVVLPKIKRRKVSAVRDFPEGCGSKAPLIQARPAETTGSVRDFPEGCGPKAPLIQARPIEVTGSVRDFPEGCGSKAPLIHTMPTEVTSSACDFPEGRRSKAPLIHARATEVTSYVLDFPEGRGPKAPLIHGRPTEHKSSVRDFPEGCGSKSPLNHAAPTEVTGPVGGICENIQGSGKSEAPLDADYIETSVDGDKAPLPQPLQDAAEIEVLKTSTNPKASFEKPVALSKIDSEATSTNNEPGEIESINPLDNASLVSSLNPSKHEVSELLKSSHKTKINSSGLKLMLSPARLADTVKKTLPWNYPPRRKVSAIRDFPPFSGRNSPPLVKEHCMKGLASSKSIGLDKQLMNSTVRNDFKVIRDNAQNEVNLEIIVSETIEEKIKAELQGDGIKKLKKKFVSGTSFGHRTGLEGQKKETIITTGNGVNQLNYKTQTYYKKSDVEMNRAEGNVGNEIVVYCGEVAGVDAKTSKDIVIYEMEESDTQLIAGNVGLDLQMDRVIVQGLFAAHSPMEQQKNFVKPNRGSKQGCSFSEEGKSKRKKAEIKKLESLSLKRILPIKKVAYQDTGELVVYDNQDDVDSSEDEQQEDFHVAYRSRSPMFDVSLPPFGLSSSSGKDNNHDTIVTRNKVRETLRTFQIVCRKLLQEEEAKSKQGGNGSKRVDLLAAKMVKSKGKNVNAGKQILGPVPGVEVGDEFHFRVELAIVGLHRPFQAGIDYLKHNGKLIATSIVASEGYADHFDNSDVLIYMGSGGKDADKQPEDQKLERGNLALRNSANEKSPVRVIRGFKEKAASESSDTKARVVSTFTYDGLYLVDKYWQEPGPHDKLVFQFQLVRIPGQPELAWNEVKRTKKLKIREGLCVDDISQGKEMISICGINTVNDELPPQFIYINKMIYPNWCNPIPPKGCGCTGRCSESERCLCAVKNGVEIPYNHNGAIVEAKPLVYECGPSCKCPPSCYNRVSQLGIKFQLEVFKTESRGWGVRSLNSISSGSFICEYLGELLDDKEAEQRTGSDEYLFDIGHNYNDQTLCGGFPKLADSRSDSHEAVEDCGFTIDAAQYGNVGRFINHSCSPNLYAQNVLYDHEDKRMPHIMLFAAENIPPLQELTYHYNYSIDEVRDSHGNVKKKNCYCGSPECVGRMY